MSETFKRFLRKLRNFWFHDLRNELKGSVVELSSLGRIPYQRHRNIDAFEINRMQEDPIYLNRYGYKVFSEADEDGIIAEIFKRIGVTNKKFVDFGAGDGLQSNSHFLLHQGWSGVWIEGSQKQCRNISESFLRPIAEGRLLVIQALVSAENINSLIGSSGGVNGEIDFLSVDIDGNDYWVWRAIKCISPRVVIIEYNAKFPPTFEWIMRYDENHAWRGDDEHGASLKALEVLGTELGYQLVGTSTNGVNAFFVKKSLALDYFPLPATAENLFHSWGGMGIMPYVSGHPARKYIGV